MTESLLPEEFRLPPVVLGNPTMEAVDRDIAAPLMHVPGARWWIAFAVAAGVMLVGFALMGYTFAVGVGVWGINAPVYWAFAIVNFVFWIGIGHAGTLISAILLLFRQRWRNAIARLSETLTIFAVMTAAMFPLLHLGRPWVFFWIFPYPNSLRLWVNFRSPLVWDVFAILTYLTVSIMFWYVGLIPDLAALRERAATRVHRAVYSFLSWGWTGLSRHWHHYELAYLILAGLATPLVLSVHTIVSFDFSTSIIPGWHSTIFPPYFVAGAVFSGFAMVMVVILALRGYFHLEHLITMTHLDNMNKILLATSLMVGYSYVMEFFIAWYSADEIERYAFHNRAFGPYWWALAIMLVGNVVAPQVHWFRRARRSIPVMFVVALAVLVGMWIERFVIIVVSLHRDFLPSAWGMYWPTIVDVGILAGSFGFFFTATLIFVRVLPSISMTEVKSALPGAQPSIHAARPMVGRPVEKIDV